MGKEEMQEREEKKTLKNGEVRADEKGTQTIQKEKEDLEEKDNKRRQRKTKKGEERKKRENQKEEEK